MPKIRRRVGYKFFKLKKAILLLILSLGVLSLNGQNYETFNGCPPEGDAKGIDDQNTNKLKNRYTFPSEADIDHSITLQRMLEPGNDENRFTEAKAATITGYVVKVNKKGSSETCNCHASAPMFTDTHIEVVLDKEHAGKQERVIVEITPRIRAIMATKGEDWSGQALQNLIGKRVTFTGWMLWDWRHKKDAENTDPGDTKQNWRATCWELHPVTSIEIEDSPQDEDVETAGASPLYFTSSVAGGGNNGGPSGTFAGNKITNPPSGDPGQLLTIILLSAILGMCGQVVRVFAGLLKARQSATDDKKNMKSVISEHSGQMLFSLIIALIVGGVCGVLVAISSDKFEANKATILGLITAGYAGTDFIEGFIAKR